MSPCMAEKKDNRGARALRAVELNQYQIAEALNGHQGSVSNWMSGARRPHARWRVKLQKKFGIDISAWDQDLTVSSREIRTAAR